jgi:DNA polymerase III subunit delta'
MSDREDDEERLDEEGDASAAETPAPRENPLLIGHAAAEAALLKAQRSGRMPHAWLFAGPRGVGKATLAFRFARHLLADDGDAGMLFAAPPTSLALDPSHPAFRRVASGGHPDLLVVERSVDPRSKRLRKEIVVEDTRAVAEFLHLTPAAGRWRIVILDDADLMNRNAANALLKILEEPPRQAVLLLLSDNPGRLLPTIRSRCRRLGLKPLSPAEVREALGRLRPDLPADGVAALTRLAEGSIGRALDLAAADGLSIYSSLLNMISRLPRLNYEELHGLAERFGRGEGEGFRLIAELLPAAVARLVAIAGGRREEALPEEQAAAGRLGGGRGLEHWVAVWEKLTHLFAQADGLNLDRKQVVLNAFFALEEAAR